MNKKTSTKRSFLGALMATAVLFLGAGGLRAQDGRPETTPRGDDEGDGPYDRLILRGVTIIDGTGAPPQGPVDIVIEGDRIASVSTVGYPGLDINEDRRPDLEIEDNPDASVHEIDLSGHYLMPGFVDMHAHTGGFPKAPQPEYVYKLWMGHGITTSRGVGHGPMMWALGEKAKAARHEIVAPRMYTYVRPGEAWDQGSVDSPEKAREWVRWAAAQEVEGQKIDGLKLGSYDPPIMEALIDEAHQHGLGTVAHLGQMGVGRMTALDAAEIGLDMMTHYYGLFESMLSDYSVQDWPLDYNYQNEQHRFGNVARLWDQVDGPGSDSWNALQERFLELGFGIDPTMTIYEASRDVMAARNADWHEEYTLPSQWDFYQPSRAAHGSYWFYWGTEDEVAWRNFYKVWMQFLNEYKNRGGRVTTGSDSGFIYKLYGFDYIREFELLREAGFHPVEVIRSATLHGAQELNDPKGLQPDFGMIRAGLKADFVVVEENPLQNLKVLYGTGAVKLNDETGETERVGGIKYTIKDGIVYDAKQLLADVREMVRAAKAELATQDEN
ncbi:amidohydrolase family protein [Candidatus Palauibacter sp.]|uniref:amidohydrolase family protein n=1 Tax=Candidatus Palauibacter sp. TaxID=3101350 RepID=UPI003B52C9AE